MHTNPTTQTPKHMVIMPNRVSPNFHNPKPIPMHHSSAHKTSITQPNHPALMHSDKELVPTPPPNL